MESASCEAVYTSEAVSTSEEAEHILEDEEDAQSLDFHSLPSEWPVQFSQESLISPQDYPDPEPDPRSE